LLTSVPTASASSTTSGWRAASAATSGSPNGRATFWCPRIAVRRSVSHALASAASAGSKAAGGPVDEPDGAADPDVDPDPDPDAEPDRGADRVAPGRLEGVAEGVVDGVVDGVVTLAEVEGPLPAARATSPLSRDVAADWAAVAAAGTAGSTA